MRWWQYLLTIGAWLAVGLAAEVFPVFCVIHTFNKSGVAFNAREILGYSTLVLLAFGLVTAALGDAIVEGSLFRGYCRVFLVIAVLGLPYLGMFVGEAVQADLDRRSLPNAPSLADGYWWTLETYVTLSVLALCALIKVTMLYEREP